MGVGACPPVLLVSDPTGDRAGAAVDVAVGPRPSLGC